MCKGALEHENPAERPFHSQAYSLICITTLKWESMDGKDITYLFEFSIAARNSVQSKGMEDYVQTLLSSFR